MRVNAWRYPRWTIVLWPVLRLRHLSTPGLSRRHQGHLLGWPRNPLRCCLPQRILIVEAQMVTGSLSASAHWSRASFGLREVCKLLTRLPGIKAPHGRRLLVDAALVGAVAARGGTGASRRRAQAAPGGIRRGASEGAPALRLQFVRPPSASPAPCTPLAQTELRPRWTIVLRP